jgi:hypothetical protein
MSGRSKRTSTSEVPASVTHTTDTDLCPACKLHREHTPEAHAALVRRERNADFTRKRARPVNYRVYVAYSRTKAGEWSKGRVILASFRMKLDADLWADQLRKANPTWIVEVR